MEFFDIMTTNTDYYELIGVSKGASAEEIKTESLSWQFTPGTEPNMDYYRYVGEKRNEKLAS